MLREERLWRIAERLTRDRQVSSSALAAEYGLTPASVRTDLSELERRGIARRVYGGAVLPAAETTGGALKLEEADVRERVEEQHAEKVAIGRAAAALVRDGETVMIDGGTTTYEVIRNLSDRHNLTIVSCAVNDLWESLAERSDLEVFLTGGFLRAESLSLVGDVAETALRGFRANKAILGMDGISAEHGLTTLNFLEAGIKRRMIEGSQELIVVADHSKFEKVCLIPVALLSRASTIVTDPRAPAELLEQIRQTGVRVIVAEV